MQDVLTNTEGETMTTATATEIIEMAGTSLRELAVAGHEQGYTHLIVHTDDTGAIDDAIVTETADGYYRSADGEWESVYKAGCGSCPCNCEACQNGDDPADWAGDGDACDFIRDEIERGLDELSDSIKGA